MPVSAIGSDEPMIGWVLMESDGTVLSERNGDVVVSAASTIKLGVLLAVLLRVDDGSVDLASTIRTVRSFQTAAPGHARFVPDPEDADEDFPPDGTMVSIGELARAMIVRSSNEATNALIALTGEAGVNAAVASAGAARTTLGRLLGDAPAVAAGLDNTTTAGDLALIMRAIVTGDLLAPGSTAFARTLLAEQRFPRIGLEIPEGVWWGSKSGDVPGVEHDVAAIGERDTRMLAVCTRGIAQAAARESIRAVAAILQSCFVHG